jgi:hypothetical protein
VSSYEQFLEEKALVVKPSGITRKPDDLHPALFPHQRALNVRTLAQGKFCNGANTGLGKTLMQLDCCDQLVRETDKPALIIAPLAVSHQTAREAERFSIAARVIAEQSDIDGPGIYITNYQKLPRFNLDDFATICLDEGSAIKNDTGKWSTLIRDLAKDKPFRLSYSATFAPNDFAELGMQSEFLGVMSQKEMLAMFFTHDGHDQKGAWQLKGHAKRVKFWQWLSSWCALVRKPSDIGDYDDSDYVLPGLKVHEHAIESHVDAPEGVLAGTWIPSSAIADKRHINKSSLMARCQYASDLANDNPEQWVIWCNTADESKMLAKLIPEAVEVKGSDKDQHKIDSITRFQSGNIRVIVTKDSIFGFGVNLQNCAHTIVFPNDSYERYYQLVRRFYRFGQTRTVHVHRVYHQLESWTTLQNVERKQSDADLMFEALRSFQLQRFQDINAQTTRDTTPYNPQIDMVLPDWLVHQSNLIAA